MNWILALAITIAAAGFEAICAGRDPMNQLKDLRQPSWSPPVWLWMLIGIVWYSICIIGLVRLLPYWPAQKLPVVLLIALLVVNGAANIPLFRLRRLDVALTFFLPYWALLGTFMWVAGQLDQLTFVLFAAYGVYQLYAVVWSYRLLKLNGPANQ
jgi:tryptophan-rich sensory protein